MWPMVDRIQEVRHLMEAERHIAAAESLLSRMQEIVTLHRQIGVDPIAAEKGLIAMEEALHSLRAHRDLIVRTLSSLDVCDARRS